MALAFIVGFYSYEWTILAHFFNLLVVMGLSCKVRIENKTWISSHIHLKKEPYYCIQSYQIDVKLLREKSEPSTSWAYLDWLNICSQQPYGTVLPNSTLLFSWSSPFLAKYITILFLLAKYWVHLKPWSQITPAEETTALFLTSIFWSTLPQTSQQNLLWKCISRLLLSITMIHSTSGGSNNI